jgi:competence protein ComEA
MDSLASSRRRLLAAIAAVLIVAVLAVRHFARDDAGATNQPGPILPADAAPAGAGGRSRLVVHVVGAVYRPGLYSVREGARIADLESINLAAPVEDGLQVVVPRRIPVAQPGAGPAGEGAAATGGKVHLNTATLEQLDGLPGVGPVTAQKILDYREQHGAFTSIDDLDTIAGIGPKRLEQLREAASP